MNTKKLLGRKIKEIRKKKGLKQEQLAEIVGLEPASICNIENAYNYPTLQNLEKITKALDVEMFEIFKFDYHQDSIDLLKDINQLLIENPDKIQTIYKIIKAII